MGQSGTVSSFLRHTITFPQPQKAEETSSLTPARCSMPALKSTQGATWPQLLGSRQLNQGESSPTPQQLHPLLESQTAECISVKIALGLCVTWPPTQSTKLVLLCGEEPAFLEHISSDSFGFLPWEDGLCQWRRLLISTDNSKNFNR